MLLTRYIEIVINSLGEIGYELRGWVPDELGRLMEKDYEYIVPSRCVNDPGITQGVHNAK